MASLSLAFNQMAEELDQAKDAERSFLLSVSHELKTPLASIRGHGEALLDRVLDVPKGAGVIVQEAKRLERLVRDLLDLARLNQRVFTVTPQPVDLARSPRRPSAGTRTRRAGSASPSSPTRRAARRRPRTRTGCSRCSSNLIENALRSTPAGGSVTVTATPGELSVADTGPGLARRGPSARVRALLSPHPIRARTGQSGPALAWRS